MDKYIGLDMDCKKTVGFAGLPNWTGQGRAEKRLLRVRYFV